MPTRNVVVPLGETFDLGDRGIMHDVRRWLGENYPEATRYQIHVLALPRDARPDGDRPPLLVRMGGLLTEQNQPAFPNVTIVYLGDPDQLKFEMETLGKTLGRATVVFNGAAELHAYAAARIYDALQGGELLYVEAGVTMIVQEK
jgi:hypothetical protein